MLASVALGEGSGRDHDDVTERGSRPDVDEQTDGSEHWQGLGLGDGEDLDLVDADDGRGPPMS
jgi:hypothetical protein